MGRSAGWARAELGIAGEVHGSNLVSVLTAMWARYPVPVLRHMLRPRVPDFYSRLCKVGRWVVG